MLQVKTLSRASIPRNPASRYTFTPGTEEEDYCAQIFQQARNHQKIIHSLEGSEGTYFGFIALSFGVFAKRTSLVIDFLFTSVQYRSQAFDDLGGLKISDYLLAYAFQRAIELNEIVPVRYVALFPASDALEEFYRRRGFSTLDDTFWMFSKIGSTSPAA